MASARHESGEQGGEIWGGLTLSWKAKQSQLRERSDSRISDGIMLDVVDPSYSWIVGLQICFLGNIYL